MSWDSEKNRGSQLTADEFNDMVQYIKTRIDKADEANPFITLDEFFTDGIYRNAIINGNFDIWQRGTEFEGANGVYTADRFEISSAAVPE